MSLESTTKRKRPRVILPSLPNEKTEQAEGKKEKPASKTADMKKLEKQLCNCYSLEYAQVSKFEVSPFTALLNLLKSTYEATPEIFKTVVALLLEYDPHPKVDNRQATARCLRVLLDKNPDLADCLISMLPEQLSAEQAFSNPLAALPTRVKPEQWKGAIQSRQPHDKEQSPAAQYYNYSTPAVNAFIATQGIPSKVTSKEGQLIQPTLVQHVMGTDNNLLAIRMANPPSKTPVLLYGPYTVSSGASGSEPVTVPQKNIVPLVPTKQPGAWSSPLPIGSSVSTPPQSAVSIGNKQAQSLPLHVPSIITTTNTSSLASSVQFAPESIRMRAKRKLAVIESPKLSQNTEEQSVDVESTSNSETRNSQQFPYDQEIVFKDSSGHSVNVEYAEGNYLACLAQMVEQLPPIPIPKSEVVEDMGSSGMNIQVSRTRTSKGVLKVKTGLGPVAKGVDKWRQEVSGAGGDNCEDANSTSSIDIDSMNECTSQSLGNSQVSCMSNEDSDGLHLVVDDMNTKGDFMDKYENECSSSLGSSGLVVDE